MLNAACAVTGISNAPAATLAVARLEVLTTWSSCVATNGPSAPLPKSPLRTMSPTSTGPPGAGATGEENPSNLPPGPDVVACTTSGPRTVGTPAIWNRPAESVVLLSSPIEVTAAPGTGAP